MKFPIERQIPTAFAIAIILLIALGFFAYTNLTALNSAIAWELHTQQVLQKLDRTLLKLVDAETATRGFVITGDESVLESFDQTGKPVFDDIDELRSLTADNPSQTERLANIEQLTRRKISVLNRQIDARRRSDQAEIAAIIKTGEGRETMSKIRALLEQMKSLETALLREREDIQQNNFKRAVYLSIFGSAAGILILLLANIAINRQIKLRRRAEDDLKSNYKELEKRVETRTRELAETNRNLQTQIGKREEAEDRQKFAIEAGQFGIWRLDTTNGIYEADARALELSGVAPDNFDGRGATLFKNIHPDDLPVVKKALDDALEKGSNYFAEFRILAPDNSTRWLQAAAQPQKNGGGKFYLTGFSSDITARKEYEISLEKSERHLRSVIDSLGTLVGVLKPDGTLVEINRAALEISGQQPEDVLNRHFADTFWWNFSEESQNRLRRAISQAAEGKTSRYDTEIQIDANSLITIDFMIAPLFDENGTVTYLIPSGMDLTDRRQIENALRKSELFNRSTLNSLSSHIAVVDRQGVIVTVNNAWDEFAKQNNPASFEELNHVGTNYLQVCTPGDPDPILSAISENLREILSGRSKSFSVEYPCHSPAEKRWFLLNINALHSDEGGAVISHTNITDRIIAETERERLLTLEKKARLEAEAANRVRDEFLATVSHELRNPLNAILGWSRLLQKNRLDSNASSKAVDAVVRNAESQNHLIEDLLDVSRIIAGKMRLDIAPVSPLNFVQAAIETVRPAAEAKDINLNISIDPQIGKINGDVNRLQQVIWNLLSNAIKFTPKNGFVGIDAVNRDSMVELKISDNGIGIAQEFLPNVFERFRQADASTVRKFGGLGLGLAIVRHIVEMHGGTVEVFSEGENQGSQFVVKLPINAVAVKNEQISSAGELKFQAESEEPEVDLRHLSILTVDDEPDTCRLLSEILSYYGARVQTASSAAEAFEAFQNRHFDIIISDIGMPEEDGCSLLQKIRSLPDDAGKNVKAIALTAFTREADRRKTLEAGFQTHVSKPVEPSELIRIVVDLSEQKAMVM